MPRTGLKCLNANVIYYATYLSWGGGAFFTYSDLIFFDDLHLQIIASISPKASVENSSAQWAIFLILWRQSQYSQGSFLTICDVAF